MHDVSSSCIHHYPLTVTLFTASTTYFPLLHWLCLSYLHRLPMSSNQHLLDVCCLMYYILVQWTFQILNVSSWHVFGIRAIRARIQDTVPAQATFSIAHENAWNPSKRCYFYIHHVGETRVWIPSSVQRESRNLLMTVTFQILFKNLGKTCFYIDLK